jgi:hypothetical protein
MPMPFDNTKSLLKICLGPELDDLVLNRHKRGRKTKSEESLLEKFKTIRKFEEIILPFGWMGI